MSVKRVKSVFMATPTGAAFPHLFEGEYLEKTVGDAKQSFLIPGTLKDLRPLTEQEITALDEKKGCGYLLKIRSDIH